MFTRRHWFERSNVSVFFKKNRLKDGFISHNSHIYRYIADRDLSTGNLIDIWTII